METVKRDLRIDFLRGIALFIVIFDHMELQSGSRVISNFTLQSFCYFDGAELFVFLSGFVSGMVYQKTLIKLGFQKCQAKSLRRCVQIYAAFIITHFIVINIIYSTAEYGELVGHFPYSLELLLNFPVKSIFWTTVCMCPLFGLDIYFMYMCFLVVMPTILFTLNKSRNLTLALILALYILTQFYPSINIPRYPWNEGLTWGTGRFFNFFSWFFLFFLGAYISTRASFTECQKSLFCRISFFLISIITFFTLCLLKNSFGDIENFECHKSLSEFVNQFIDKRTLGPLRIVHFLSLIGALNSIFPTNSKYRLAWSLKPIVACGQNSFTVAVRCLCI